MKRTTKKKTIKKNLHLGSTFDSFLKEEGIYEEVKAAAMKKGVALQSKRANS